MAREWQPVDFGGTGYLTEWPNLTENDTDPAYRALPAHFEKSVQLISLTGPGPVILEWSLNVDDDATKVWERAADSTQTPISLTVPGQGFFVLQNAVLWRARVDGGVGVVAQVRLLAMPQQ